MNTRTHIQVPVGCAYVQHGVGAARRDCAATTASLKRLFEQVKPTAGLPGLQDRLAFLYCMLRSTFRPVAWASRCARLQHLWSCSFARVKAGRAAKPPRIVSHHRDKYKSIRVYDTLWIPCACRVCRSHARTASPAARALGSCKTRCTDVSNIANGHTTYCSRIREFRTASCRQAGRAKVARAHCCQGGWGPLFL